MRRGVGSLIHAGTPYFPGQAPLLETDISTVEGLERLGGQFGVSVPPAGLASYVRSRRPVVVPGSRRWGGAGVQGYRRGMAGATITNAAGASSTAFHVGDSWRIAISGAPANALVFLNATQCSPDFSRCAEMPMSGQQDIALSNWTGTYQDGSKAIGSTDAAGNFSMSGTFTPAQVGMWTQNFTAGGQQAGGIQFTVADAAGSATYGGAVIPSGTPYYQQIGQQPAITGVVPKPEILNLEQMLKQLGIALPGSASTSPAPSSAPSSSTGSAVTHPATGGGSAAHSSSGNAVPADTFDVGGFLSGSVFMGIPNWILMAAVLGGFLVFGGKR